MLYMVYLVSLSHPMSYYHYHILLIIPKAIPQTLTLLDVYTTRYRQVKVELESSGSVKKEDANLF